MLLSPLLLCVGMLVAAVADCVEENDECGLLATVRPISHVQKSATSAQRETRSRGEPIIGPGGNDTCPGMVYVGNYQPVALTNAYIDTPTDPKVGKVSVENGRVVAYMKGRTYFSSTCNAGWYTPMRYTPLPLLGRTFRYTIDFNGAGCGCNAALYLTSLNQNTAKSGCDDYYCDANSVCGVPCAEIDIMEANAKAWHSTLHVWNDPNGQGVGYGGGATGANGWSGPRNWNSSVYGPGASCICTSKPVNVAVSFPVGADGMLSAMNIVLEQNGCELTASINDYPFNKYTMQELTAALGAGMTPIISYWSSADMLWLDGEGQDGLGPCARDTPKLCSESVKFYDFSVDTPATSVWG